MATRRQKESCVFCKIVGGKETTVLLYQDDEIVVFNDIHPASTYHFLVCPIDHIRDASRLNKSHIPLVENMVAISKRLLEERGADLSQARLGMHWPPFISVSHLHMHVIWPDDKIGFFVRAIGKFNPSTYWFRSTDWLLERLKNMPEESTSPVTSPESAQMTSPESAQMTSPESAQVTSQESAQVTSQKTSQKKERGSDGTSQAPHVERTENTNTDTT